MFVKELLLLLFALCIFPIGSSYSQRTNLSDETKNDLKEILNKKKVTILITDSGLGGMSVCAGLEKKLKEAKSFEEVNLIFFNALPEKGYGYNSMPSNESKALVFNEALVSMERKFSPDLILIACNTLSVVYPFTRFSRESKTPVLGIVEFGVSMILSELKKNENSEVMILGTETTINSDTHKNKLIQNGVKRDKIISQSFPGLESEIQDSPESETVKGMIELYIGESAQKLNHKNSPVIAALCCTHYGFCAETFYSSLKNITNRKIILLNPNELMINAIILEKNRGCFQQANVSMSVVSRAIIDDGEKKSIGGLINSYAPLSSIALMNYEYNPELFKFQKE